MPPPDIEKELKGFFSKVEKKFRELVESPTPQEIRQAQFQAYLIEELKRPLYEMRDILQKSSSSAQLPNPQILRQSRAISGSTEIKISLEASGIWFESASFSGGDTTVDVLEIKFSEEQTYTPLTKTTSAQPGEEFLDGFPLFFRGDLKEIFLRNRDLGVGGQTITVVYYILQSLDVPLFEPVNTLTKITGVTTGVTLPVSGTITANESPAVSLDAFNTSLTTTATALASNICKVAICQAASNNTDYILIGETGPGNQFFELHPLMSISLPVENTDLIFAKSNTGTQTLHTIFLN